MTQVPCDKPVLFERTGGKDEIMKKVVAHMQVFSFMIFYELYKPRCKKATFDRNGLESMSIRFIKKCNTGVSMRMHFPTTDE